MRVPGIGKTRFGTCRTTPIVKGRSDRVGISSSRGTSDDGRHLVAYPRPFSRPACRARPATWMRKSGRERCAGRVVIRCKALGSDDEGPQFRGSRRSPGLCRCAHGMHNAGFTFGDSSVKRRYLMNRIIRLTALCVLALFAARDSFAAEPARRCWPSLASCFLKTIFPGPK